MLTENVKLDIGYRVDLWVEQKVIIEVKSVDALNDVHLAQVLTYLKLSGCKFAYNSLRPLRLYFFSQCSQWMNNDATYF
jgi:hypothetical protein